MPFSSGTFSVFTPGTPYVTGTTISSSVANSVNSDFATGLSTAILKDGSQTITANLPMSSFKFTGLAAGSTAGDSVRYEQVLLLTGGTVTGAVSITGLTSNLIVGGASIVQNSKSEDYTTVATDANKHILHPTADDNPRTFTIDSNANVAYAVGTCITFVNQQNTVTIAITDDTLTLMGAGSTGSRTLAENGIATALKVASTSWVISGTNLT